MSEQEGTPFNFWWPTSEKRGNVMLWVMGIIGVLGFIKGCIDEGLPDDFDSRYGDPMETIVSICLSYVAVNIAGWYFIINIGRFVYSRVQRTEAIKTMQETRRERAELESLRRRSEIKKLRDELGDEG